MSKIDQILPGSTPPVSPGSKTDKTQGGDFKKILGEAVARCEAPDQAQAAPPVQQAGKSADIDPTQAVTSGAPPQAVETAERFLVLLEKYAQVLGDEANQGLKQVDAALRELKASAGEVDEVLANLDENDPLFAILSEMRAKVDFEESRLMSGDYLPGA